MHPFARGQVPDGISVLGWFMVIGDSLVGSCVLVSMRIGPLNL